MHAGYAPVDPILEFAIRADCKPVARTEVVELTKRLRLACAGFTWRRAVDAQAGSYTALVPVWATSANRGTGSGRVRRCADQRR